MDSNVKGLGKNVPPSKEHVVIYFLQKGCSEQNALEFYQYFKDKDWKNNQNKQLSNWKMAAWEWILKQFVFKRQN